LRQDLKKRKNTPIKIRINPTILKKDISSLNKITAAIEVTTEAPTVIAG
jgi:hypothetical protein